MIDLSNEITKALREYTSEVSEQLEIAKDEVTKQAVSGLKANSPKDKGKYAKGWTRKKQGNGYIIHNRTDYQLTHLLEHGHVKRGGGRVKAYRHIAPVEEKAIKEFTERVEKAVKG